MIGTTCCVFYNYHQTLDAPGGRTWGRDVRRAVERLGETPQGIVLLHHGIGAFQGWDVWSALCGMADRRFEYFKGERVRVHVADPDAPHHARAWPIGRSWTRSTRCPL